MTKDERIKWLEYLFYKNSFAFMECLTELQKRGMTSYEVYEFVDEINNKYDREFNGKKFD